MMKERNYRAFWALLGRLPRADKEALVLAWTGGATSHLSEMTETQWRAMMRALRNEVEPAHERRRLRSQALHLMQRLGIDTTRWREVDRFCLDPRIASQPFHKLSSADLQALVRKLRSISRKRERADQEERWRSFALEGIRGQKPN